MTKNVAPVDCFLIKENDIISFKAKIEEGSLCTEDASAIFASGDIIISKISGDPQLASVDIVVSSFKNMQSKSTTVMFKNITPDEVQIKDIKNKLRDFEQHVHASDASREIKDSLLAKSEELEKAVGTSKFDQIFQEFAGLLMEYEQYIPAVLEFLKL